MSVGVEAEGAIRAIESSAEQALGQRGEERGISPELIQWGMEHGLQDAPLPRLRKLRKESSFDSLRSRLGAVWWPPLKATGEVPIIVGLTRNGKDFGIRIALCRVEEGVPQAIGMRFEAPHEGSDAHEFHHAQLWTYIRKGDEASRIVDPNIWIPEDQPSFPLQAKNPLELLWSAAVSVYGKGNAQRPFEANETVRGKIAEYVKKLR